MLTSLSKNKLDIVSAMSWLVTLGLWIILWFFNPYSQAETLSIPGMIMLLLAIAGIVSSYLMKPMLLLALALLSFIPIGIYLLGTPGIFLFIGILNIVSIVLAARLMFVRTRNRAMSDS